ncbi:MAG: hypothetical protein JSR77_00880 [Planctomycetes bacterium]|nr:hypothetical protein [Planctomycetota bacterium]
MEIGRARAGVVLVRAFVYARRLHSPGLAIETTSPRFQSWLSGSWFMFKILRSAFLASILAGMVGAQTSTSSISLQAKLTGVPDGTASLAVKFYDSLTGGSQVGSTITLSAVPVQGGIVSVPVSPVDASIFNGATRYMGIRVNGGAELSPRTLVTSVPYAMRATGLAGPLATFSGQAISFEFLDSVDPEVQIGGHWAIGTAFAPGNFGIVRYRGSADVSRSLVMTAAGNVGIGTASPQATLDCAGSVILRRGLDVKMIGGNYALEVNRDTGVTSVRVLTITGADVAEPFDLTKSDILPDPLPGMVVSIDPANAGKLVVCSTPYDKKVAGAISGAGGLSVGVVMGKDNADPLIAGDHPVAMSGRVYVLCDATLGAIRPGDRLTTSSTPGHAMKAIDPAQWDGAVIGKAMTELKEGKGLVLVLVNLQ